MNRCQDISISDASLKAEFITKFFNGDYIDAFTIISNNPQLNTKAFVADTINQIATILLSLENNFQNGVIDYLTQQYSNFQNIIDNYNLKGNWSASTTYQIYNFVTYNNIDYLYINLTPSSGNLPTNTEYWVEVNIQGEKGAPGLGVNLQYNWSATTPYNALDVVYYNNALWVARVANINKIPGSTEEWETLSGSIVSFYNDGDIEISNLSVDIEPVQDLHGYESPWPAGGGKNKFAVPSDLPITSKGITLFYDGYHYVVTGTATGTVRTQELALDLAVGVYILSANQTSDKTRVLLYKNGTLARSQAKNDAAYSFNVESGDVITCGLQILSSTENCTIEPQIESGSTATTYAPYSNICPISGWDAADIEAAGENLWGGSAFLKLADNWANAVVDTDAMTLTGRIDYLTTRANVFEFPFKQNTKYTIFMNASVANTGFYAVYADGTEASIVTTRFVSNPSKTLAYLRFYIATSSAITFYANGIGVFEGDVSADAFKPYSGNRYTIQLGDTIYGAKLTIAEDGSVTALVDTVKAIADGTIAPTSSSINSASFLRRFPEAAGYTLDATALKCNRLKPSNYSSANDNIILFSNANIVTMRVSEEVTDWVSWFRDNPVEFSYKIANPITIQLDPVTISTISGQTNNVWADAGDVSVELDKKYWEEFIKFKLASIYTDYIEPSAGSLYNGLIWFEVFNPQNWSYLTNRNYTWNQINTNNDTWESVDRGDY